MISVIIPTMWAYEPFLNFLENILELNCVGEVIIINNLVSDTPNHLALNHPKVKMHNMHQNIYVNPAWNLGAQLSQYDTLCFLSDDVLVDLKVFQEANKFVTNQIGVLGFGYHPAMFTLHSQKIINQNEVEHYIVTGDIQIKETSENGFVHKTGYGALFFLHKQNYVPIPKEFLISGGDNWLYECQTILGRINYYINNCFFYTPWSVTATSSKFDGTLGDFSKENRETFVSKIEEFKRLNGK